VATKKELYDFNCVSKSDLRSYWRVGYFQSTLNVNSRGYFFLLCSAKKQGASWLWKALSFSSQKIWGNLNSSQV